MRDRPLRFRIPLRSALTVAWLIGCSLVSMTSARADDPFGFYIGAAYGQAHMRAQPVTDPLVGPGRTGNVTFGELHDTHSAFQAMLGVRPLSLLGAEITYMDFGRSVTAAVIGGPPFAAQASQKGEAAYALLYLPVPVIDIYLKAGASRITTDRGATLFAPAACFAGSPDCLITHVSHSATDTSFAYGTGLQWKLGHWAVRGEYERFSVAGAHPSLLSIGMTFWLH